MTRLVLASSLVFFACFSHAQRFQPIEHPIGTAEKIVIRGFKGQLQIIPAQDDILKVEAQKKGNGDFDRWTFQVKQNQNAVEVFVKGPSEQEDWEKLRAGQVPPFDMRITAPLRPLEIFWGEGSFSASGWKSNLSLQMTQGAIKVSESMGNLNLQLINGRIAVDKHQGNVDIQSFKGQVVTDETKGAMTLNNHSSIYKLTNHEGPVELRNHSGSVTMNKIKGRSVVKNVSGVVRLLEYSGSFDGDFSKGELRAKVKSLQSFSVISDDAAITLDAPKESGAMVSLRSEKGSLWAPIHLRKTKKGLWTERNGRLKGKEQGNIKIISKYGNIVLK